MPLLLDQFDFPLPESLIAQYPLPKRSDSKLLHLSSNTGTIDHLKFSNLYELLLPNDLLIFNNTRVIKARLLGEKITGGKIEILIERVIDNYQALAQIRSNKKIKIGMEVILTNASSTTTATTVVITVTAKHNDFFVIQFATTTNTNNTTTPTANTFWKILQQYGHIPLPPYIERADSVFDEERYQSIFAQRNGAVAAPTASLHFDHDLMLQIRNKNVAIAFVTLHVGAGTFQPVRVTSIEQHQMHAEYMEITPEVCAKIEITKKQGGRVIAVGTTCVRCLETAAAAVISNEAMTTKEQKTKKKIGEEEAGKIKKNIAPTEKQIIKPFCGDTNIFIYPGFKFRCVDALITNFHLPKSTLLMLVCAFAGYENTMLAYTTAITLQYRFFSYGDAMLIT